jgi:hypothetical protein
MDQVKGRVKAARKALAGLRDGLDSNSQKISEPVQDHETMLAGLSLNTGGPNLRQTQWFLAGACLGTLPRSRAGPGRVFEGFGGQPKDPMEVKSPPPLQPTKITPVSKLCEDCYRMM